MKNYGNVTYEENRNERKCRNKYRKMNNKNRNIMERDCKKAIRCSKFAETKRAKPLKKFWKTMCLV